jgi:hypothetical protein
MLDPGELRIIHPFGSEQPFFHKYLKWRLSIVTRDAKEV